MFGEKKSIVNKEDRFQMTATVIGAGEFTIL